MSQSSLEIAIDFGRPEWQPHLGGDFYSPESIGDISYMWAGKGRCWCVVPKLQPETDYAMRLEAAPFVPFESQLYEMVVESSGSQLLRRVAPFAGENSPAHLSFSAEEHRALCVKAFEPLEVFWRMLPNPSLFIEANGLPVGTAGYDPKPDLQPRDLVLRRELIAAQTVLFFTPADAVSQKEVSGSGDERLLSFRFFRLTLRPLS